MNASVYTHDAAGQVYRDGVILWQIALSTSPRDREAAAARLAALLNAAEPRPATRMFPDGERYEFLRPADTPARAIPLDGCDPPPRRIARTVPAVDTLPLHGQ